MKCDYGEIRLFTIQSTVSINQGSPDGKGGFLLVYQSIYITPLTKNSKSDDFTITPIDAYKVSIQTKINTEMKVIY